MHFIFMVHLLISNKNELELAGIRMENKNNNKLITLPIEIKIEMNYIVMNILFVYFILESEWIVASYENNISP